RQKGALPLCIPAKGFESLGTLQCLAGGGFSARWLKAERLCGWRVRYSFVRATVFANENEILETPNFARSKNTPIPPPNHPARLGKGRRLPAVGRPHGRVLLWCNREWTNFWPGHASFVRLPCKPNGRIGALRQEGRTPPI